MSYNLALMGDSAVRVVRQSEQWRSVVVPVYRVTSWDRRRSITTTREHRLLLNYAFLLSSSWESLVPLFRRSSVTVRRLKHHSGSLLEVSTETVVGISALADSGYWDQDRTRSQEQRVLELGDRIMFEVGGHGRSGDVVEIGPNRVVVRDVASGLRVVLQE